MLLTHYCHVKEIRLPATTNLFLFLQFYSPLFELDRRLMTPNNASRTGDTNDHQEQRASRSRSRRVRIRSPSPVFHFDDSDLHEPTATRHCRLSRASTATSGDFRDNDDDDAADVSDYRTIPRLGLSGDLAYDDIMKRYPPRRATPSPPKHNHDNGEELSSASNLVCPRCYSLIEGAHNHCALCVFLWGVSPAKMALFLTSNYGI